MNDGGVFNRHAAFVQMAPHPFKVCEVRDNIMLESGKTFMTSFNHVYYAFSPAG